MRRGVFLSAFAAWLFAPATSHAHPLVEGAVAEAQQGNFEVALTVFAQAEVAPDLTGQDRIVLYSERALVFHALGDTDKRDADLRALVALDPDHAFSARHPSGLVEAFHAIERPNPPRPIRDPVEHPRAPSNALPGPRLEREPSRHPRRALWIGVGLGAVGVAAAATVAVILLAGASSSSTLLKEPNVDFGRGAPGS